jgi:hypothetical protein
MTATCERVPLRPSPREGSTQQPGSANRRSYMSRPACAGRCFPSLSPTLRPWIAARRLRSSRARVVLRGGVLEPEPRALGEIGGLKHRLIARRHFALARRGSFSLRRGLDPNSVFSSWASPLSVDGAGSPWSTKKATRWVALDWLAMRARDLARIPPSEGLHGTGPKRRRSAMRARIRLDGQGRFGE